MESELVPPGEILTWEQFAVEVDRTGSSADASGDGSFERQMRLVCIGVFEEAGEVVGLIKKHVYHHKPLDTAKIAMEIGDVLWYLTHGHNCCERGGGDPWLVGKVDARLDMATTEMRTLASLGAEAMALAMPEAIDHFVRSIFFDNHPITPVWCSNSDIGGTVRRVIRIVSILQGIGHSYGVTLGDAVQSNVTKLRLRYPHGFTAAAAQARADEVKP